MATKKRKIENAKTRYNAKNPTISFRVTRNEYEHLDELRASGRSFRTTVLLGAGIIELDEARNNGAVDETEDERINNGIEKLKLIKAETMAEVMLSICPRCLQPINRN